MNCPYDSTEMDAVGLTVANGWQCPECSHKKLEIASAKLSGTFEETLSWSCDCENCKKKQKNREEVEKDLAKRFQCEEDIPAVVLGTLVDAVCHINELTEALQKLPLEAFDKPMEQVDAAEFVDHSGEFFEAMTLARLALKEK